MKMRRCVNCGRRRPLKKMTEVGDSGLWRCTYWQGRCMNLRLTERAAWRAMGFPWARRQRRSHIHMVGA